MFMQELLQKVQFEPVKTSVALTQSYKRGAIPIQTDFEVPQARDDGDNILGNTALQRRGKHLITNRLRQLNRALLRVHGPEKTAQILGKRQFRDPRLNNANPGMFNKVINKPTIYNPTQGEMSGRPNTTTGFDALANYLMRTPLMGSLRDEIGREEPAPQQQQEPYYPFGRPIANWQEYAARQDAIARENYHLRAAAREHHVNDDEVARQKRRRPFQDLATEQPAPFQFSGGGAGRKRDNKEEEKMGGPRPPPLNLGLKRINTGGGGGHPFNGTFMQEAANADDKLDLDVVDFLKSKNVVDPLPDLNVSGVGFGGVNPALISDGGNGLDGGGANIAALANSFIGGDSMEFDDNGGGDIGAQLQGEMPPPISRPPVPFYSQSQIFDLLADADPEMQSLMRKTDVPSAAQVVSPKPPDESNYYSFQGEEEEKEEEKKSSHAVPPPPKQLEVSPAMLEEAKRNTAEQQRLFVADKSEYEKLQLIELKNQYTELQHAAREKAIENREQRITGVRQRQRLAEGTFSESQLANYDKYDLKPFSAVRHISELLRGSAQQVNDDDSYGRNVLHFKLPSGANAEFEFYANPKTPGVLTVARHVPIDPRRGDPIRSTVEDAEALEPFYEALKFYALFGSGNGKVEYRYVPRNEQILKSAQKEDEGFFGKLSSMFNIDNKEPQSVAYTEDIRLNNVHRAPELLNLPTVDENPNPHDLQLYKNRKNDAQQYAKYLNDVHTNLLKESREIRAKAVQQHFYRELEDYINEQKGKDAPAREPLIKPPVKPLTQSNISRSDKQLVAKVRQARGKQ